MSRLLAVRHAENIRELGGYQTQDGRKIAQRKLIRSAGIHQLDTQDKTYLSAYGVKKVVDFRTLEERAAKPDQEIAAAENIFLPIFPPEETDTASAAPKKMIQRMQEGENVLQQMVTVYQHFVTDQHVRGQYRKFFDLVLDNEEADRSLLFHCTAGKDRTGFAAVLLLTCLGVDDKVVMEDYLATNRYLKKVVQEMYQKAKRAGSSSEALIGIDAMMVAKELYLQTSLQQINEHYGTVEQFIHEGIGVSAQEIKDLQKIYLL
ncbi:tyrosine-protein phosphatase [Enterococcus dongliensis]|uniref:Tyrosine-protein phosphatase n=1 Tax=Enterococcus dongliensis TaxID=2559925 RepID=A0AAP5U1E1_9ENTE|nr:tyrosine-protein phosphatase [Enterococcus dongliensis]MDT2596618.1 tyrosine-protein phosphatase [Enterococcus dongliensis]MDT2603676.1 tyrosine-protein phosphatase [Enterococcus dongliensis]MDT2634396.1 tyrosine-protein phosphatase [Enterococcus dongliensis]MDT2637412.1 tyrosine-protein phosphatase [Enterococcus dongliensis]MDT2639050.1 tyrosine-protein phosphatase [Enterococcus dongliensis]